MKFVFFLLLVSCSSLKRDPQMLKDIRDWNLAGKWVTHTGHFRITCGGGFEFYEASTFYNGGMGSSEKGGWIRKLEANKLTSAPMVGLSYKINKLPSFEKNEWVMTLDKVEYVREPNFPNCP